MSKSSKFTNAIGIDVGAAKIGLARVSYIAQIAEPLYVIKNDKNTYTAINSLIAEHNIDLLVVGLPRNMNGEKTKQSEYVEKFATELKSQTNMPVVFQDETLSTVGAKERMTNKTKGMEDAVAAAIILEDYLAGRS